MNSTAPDERPLLPCLKGRTWPARQHAVCRSLCPGIRSPFVPWLAFGYDHDEAFLFVTTDRLTAWATTAEALEREALANLLPSLRMAPPLEQRLDDGTVVRMVVHDDAFTAAERILDVGFLADLQRQLETDEIVVGVPRRGLFLAVSSAAPNEFVRAFGVTVATQYDSGTSAPISPALFRVRDGVIVGLVPPAAHPVTPHHRPGAEETPASATPRRPFTWWTTLPSSIRVVAGLAVGLLVLWRVLVEIAVSLM